jgi:hypothetical protein
MLDSRLPVVGERRLERLGLGGDRIGHNRRRLRRGRLRDGRLLDLGDRLHGLGGRLHMVEYRLVGRDGGLGGRLRRSNGCRRDRVVRIP